jgi:selenide, water dikinase
MIASTTLLNRIGHVLAQDADVHGMTDVTGFGLLGHGLELARGGGVHVAIEKKRILFLVQAEPLAEAGHITGASMRNWQSYRHEVILPSPISADAQARRSRPSASRCATKTILRLWASISRRSSSNKA